MFWNSTSFDLLDFEMSSAGSKLNSTSYEEGVNTHHYQQQVGTTFSFSFQGAIRWLQSIVGIAPAEVIWEVQFCADNNTVQFNTIEQVGMTNTTVETTQQPCQYGCDNGQCIDIEQSISYSFISIITLILALLTFIMIFLRTRSPIMKVMFMILMLILLIIILFIGFSPSTLTSNGIIQQIGGISLSMFQMFTIVITLLSLVIFVFWVVHRVKIGRDVELGLGSEEDEF